MSDKIHKGISMPDMQVPVFPEAWKKSKVFIIKQSKWRRADALLEWILD